VEAHTRDHEGLAHVVILHVGAAGAERRPSQKNQVGVAGDVVSRPASRELMTTDHVPRISFLAGAVKRARTREIVQGCQAGAAALRQAAEVAFAATTRADGKPNADRGWTVFQIPSAPGVLAAVG